MDERRKTCKSKKIGVHYGSSLRESRVKCKALSSARGFFVSELTCIRA